MADPTSPSRWLPMACMRRHNTCSPRTVTMNGKARSLAPLATALSVCVLAVAVGARQGTVAAPVQAPVATVDAAVAQSAEFFETRVRPVLVANCEECHADEEKGGLRVDSRDALLTGGEGGPAIVHG